MDPTKTVTEEFLHFIWENRLFNSRNLKTTQGETLEILNPGYRNNNSGPDFFNAKIRLGDTIWAGNVEIHKKASDWDKHKHSNDRSYENVILHAVAKADKQIYRSNKTEIATIALNWPLQYFTKYKQLMDAGTWIACQNEFHKVDPILLRLSFNRLMIDRLENKTGAILSRLEENHYNWNETFYQMMSRMFGFKTNAIPFELLAKSMPVQYIAKHRNSLFQVEALLYGASGLLHEELFGDDYYLKLRKEYEFLSKKYSIKMIEPHLWKFMRMHPVNFPTIRIAQLAQLMFHSNGLFIKVIECKNLNELKKLFEVKASEYWDSHYRFNRSTSTTFPKELGESSANTLIINVIIPFLFVYGEKQNQHHLKNRALEFLEALPPENNSITRNWEALGVTARSAFETQALLQLKNNHCDKKSCLRCTIGNKLMATCMHE